MDRISLDGARLCSDMGLYVRIGTIPESYVDGVVELTRGVFMSELDDSERLLSMNPEEDRGEVIPMSWKCSLQGRSYSKSSSMNGC